MPYLVTDTCIQCGACVVGCESEAITEGETQSHIDITICVECGTCQRNCPSESIIFIDDEEYALIMSKSADSQITEETPQPPEQMVRKNTERATDQNISPLPFLNYPY